MKMSSKIKNAAISTAIQTALDYLEKDPEKNQCSFDLTIYEGKNRQIKRMMEALGYEVRRLHRKQIAFLGCSDLSQGEYRVLKPHEVKMLRALAIKGKITNLR